MFNQPNYKNHKVCNVFLFWEVGNIYLHQKVFDGAVMNYLVLNNVEGQT